MVFCFMGAMALMIPEHAIMTRHGRLSAKFLAGGQKWGNGRCVHVGYHVMSWDEVW